MKILLLGFKGQVGRCLVDQFSKLDINVIYTSRKEIDISNIQKTRVSILDINPDVVINAAAFTDVEKAETNQKEAFLINHIAVENIALICKEVDSWLIHISTDYVFDGNSFKPYREIDKTNPKTVYGKSKLNGEMAIKSSNCKYLIIRTSWVFCEYGSNFVKTMLRLSKTHKELRIVNDQVGCPTYAHDLAKAIISTLPYLKQNISSAVYHYAGGHKCSWAEFSQLIFDEAKRQNQLEKIPIIKAISSEKINALVKRPSNSVLNSKLFENDFGFKKSDWSYGMSLVVKSWEKLKAENTN